MRLVFHPIHLLLQSHKKYLWSRGESNPCLPLQKNKSTTCLGHGCSAPSELFHFYALCLHFAFQNGQWMSSAFLYREPTTLNPSPHLCVLHLRLFPTRKSEAEMVDTNLRLGSNSMRSTNESCILKSSKSAIYFSPSQIKVLDDVTPHALVSFHPVSNPDDPKEL